MKKLLVLAISVFAVSFSFAQTAYNGNGANLSDLAVSLVGDSDNFTGNEIVIEDYVFTNLAFYKSVGYYKGNQWFDDSKTVRIDDDSSSVLDENNIEMYFHPQKGDMDALKLVVQLKGKRYNDPCKVKIKAKVYKTTFPNNSQEYIVVLIEELNISDQFYRFAKEGYKGDIPDELTSQ